MSDPDDFFAKRVVYQVADMDRVHVRRDLVYKTDPELRFDLYLPESAPPADRIPVVALVHGDASPEILANAKNWGVFESLGELIAANGLAAVAFNHRSTELRTKLREAAQDVDDLVAQVREQHEELHMDPERLGLWVFSMGPPVGLYTALRERPDFIRCIVVYYGIMSLKPLREETPPEVPDEVLREFSPVDLLSASKRPLPPMLIARAGLEERPWLNPTIDRFVAEALRTNAEIDVLNHQSGRHAFEVVDDTERSRDILARTLQFVRRHLTGL
jgi:dienelactone hydrolase